jgi:diguanylate cyclase (GGDEF)-like protein
VRAARTSRHLTRDGRLLEVLVTSHPLTYEGRPARQVLVEDVTERRRLERSLRAAERRFRTALDAIETPFALLAPVDGAGAPLDASAAHADGPSGALAADFHVREATAAVGALLGADRGAIAGRSLRDLGAALGGPGGDALVALCREVLATGRPYEGDLAVGGAEVPARALHLRLVPLDDAVALAARDVTDERESFATLERLAHRDELTGLLNRRGALARVAALLDPHTPECPAARGDVLLYLDLDQFKPINDTHGHAEGDRALRAVADALRARFPGAVLGRLGGDEFVAYVRGTPGLPATSPEAREHALVAEVAAALAERVAGAAERPYALRASVGAASIRRGDTVGAVLARADARLYARKAARRADAHAA